MSSELTNERTEQTRPDAETDPNAWWRIPPKIAEAQEAFRRDLAELLETHYRQWVAYHGSERIGFGKSQTRLYQQCLAKGLDPNEFVVRGIWPDAADDCEINYPPDV